MEQTGTSSPQTRNVPPGRVGFPALGMPDYADCYAIVVDNLYSRPTLSAILAEAERQPWKFAQINSGTEVYTVPDYRNGDRIIHDSFELSEQIFAKLRPHLSAIEEIEERVYDPAIRGTAIQKWRMVRLNERLRFLRYPKGGFFKIHEVPYLAFFPQIRTHCDQVSEFSPQIARIRGYTSP